MSPFENHQNDLRMEAEKVKNNAVGFLGNLDTLYGQHFAQMTKLSDVVASYQSNNYATTQNTPLIAALTATQDAVALALDDLSIMEDYITLHIPVMEDGNNFGVTVQLMALKEIKENAEKLTKTLEELAKYYSARADAMDKLQLSSETASESTKEENDGSETKTTVTKEKKVSSGKQDFHRVQAVYAVDAQYFILAKKAFRTVKSTYVATIDFLLKNQDKIELPKGAKGTSSFASMY